MRVAAGRKLRVGLALGAGASHGWAHIGVIRRLEEAGVAPDIICGCSAGALVGAYHAAGKARHLWRSGYTTSRYAAPFDYMRMRKGRSLFGEKLLREMSEDFRRLAIEQLPFAVRRGGDRPGDRPRDHGADRAPRAGRGGFRSLPGSLSAGEDREPVGGGWLPGQPGAGFDLPGSRGGSRHCGTGSGRRREVARHLPGVQRGRAMVGSPRRRQQGRVRRRNASQPCSP